MVTKTQDKITPHPVGDSVPRVDAREKVIGAALFADDLQFGPG
jgi:CO/xanthine dehydrogenase Mo-binding subunit